MGISTFRYISKYHRCLVLIFVLIYTGKFISLVNASRYDPQWLNLIENADTPEGSNTKTSKVKLNVTIVPVDSNKQKLGFYFSIHSSLWLSDKEIQDLIGYTQNNQYVQEFRIFREKLFKRYSHYNFSGPTLKYKFLTILTCICIQGNVQVYENSLTNQFDRSISVNIPEYVTQHTNVKDWEWLESPLPDLSFLIALNDVKEYAVPNVSVGGEYDAYYYEKVIFGNQSLVTGEKGALDTQSSPETPIHENNGQEQKSSDNKVSSANNSLNSVDKIPPENNNTDGMTEESDVGGKYDNTTISDTPPDSNPDNQPETPETDQALNAKEENSESNKGKSENVQESLNSEEKVDENVSNGGSDVGETTGTNSKTEEYDETLLMDMFEAYDNLGISSGSYTTLNFTMTIRFYNANKERSVNVITKTILLVPGSIFKICRSDKFDEECAREIRNRLMGRYEDDEAVAFKWGRLISLLQALAFQNSVYVENAVFRSEKPSIAMVKPEFVLPLKSLYLITSLFGNAQSTSGKITLSFEEFKENFPTLSDSKLVDLGMNFGPNLFLKKFVQKYGNLLVTHSVNDLPLDKKTSSTETNKPTTSYTINSNEDNNGSNVSINELLDEKVNTVPLHQDIHFILSGYEKSLSNVPKKLNGYKLSWDTVSKYPELLNLWIIALDVMNLLKKGGNLKEFLDSHVFSYEQLKDLFEITYGLIASENYNSVRPFYESVGITQEDVDKNLSRVKNLFFARTATSITRLPPIVKEMGRECSIKDMITSLSSQDLVERLQLMFGTWLKDFREISDDNSFELAGLCSASAALLQQWHFFQIDQKFHESNVPWISLITSFSRLAKGKYSDPTQKNELKELVNSPAGKICRKYINSAGIVSSSPYKGPGRNIPPKSLVGAVGNALDQNMESSVDDIVNSMQRYFGTELKKKNVGNSLGICFSLQILHRMNKCLSIERSNDYALYMLNLLTMDTANILNYYTSIAEQTSPLDFKHEFIHKACDINDPTVNSILNKLFNLLSVDSHKLLVDEVNKRGFISPAVKESGELVSEESDESFDDSDIVDLSDNFMNLQDSFDSLDSESLLEIAHSIDERKHMERDISSGKSTRISDSYIGSPDFTLMENIYENIMKNHKIIDPRDMKVLNFDIRMEPQHTKELLSLNVPMSFHTVESEFIKILKGRELLHMLLYRLAKRIESLEEDIPVGDIEKRTLELAKEKRKRIFSIPVEEYIAYGQYDLQTYRNLKNILEKVPEDGFYFEQLDGEQVPEDYIGQHTAKCISKGTGTVVIQIIDPVEDYNIKNLLLNNNHIRSHDQRFYEIFVR
ncbi:hypothetical protein BEWA_017800 [Theileria equi strain WA]|uniref:Uncharacterized protein n=1 Tax=Theileria equi strain WA TaxID=1537102 RepID=L0AVN5_THEEQ|nr:hypothetical protein BEWA_017800 [Theileria equi strain WA]AFZ78939.1 hypothetical protein BEWA_017800 [Theileria equi strain WA]|eukprot:XP_004828605.1 hypothetical protein BEWA_017800 [Theileria equi strain WA]